MSVRHVAQRRALLERLRERGIQELEILHAFDSVPRHAFVPAAAPEIPAPLLEQLAEGGRLLAPVGTREAQRLLLIRRTPQGLESEEILDCTFVPLLGRFGWREGEGNER